MLLYPIQNPSSQISLFDQTFNSPYGLFGQTFNGPDSLFGRTFGTPSFSQNPGYTPTIGSIFANNPVWPSVQAGYVPPPNSLYFPQPQPQNRPDGVITGNTFNGPTIINIGGTVNATQAPPTGGQMVMQPNLNDYYKNLANQIPQYPQYPSAPQYPQSPQEPVYQQPVNPYPPQDLQPAQNLPLPTDNTAPPVQPVEPAQPTQPVEDPNKLQQLRDANNKLRADREAALKKMEKAKKKVTKKLKKGKKAKKAKKKIEKDIKKFKADMDKQLKESEANKTGNECVDLENQNGLLQNQVKSINKVTKNFKKAYKKIQKQEKKAKKAGLVGTVVGAVVGAAVIAATGGLATPLVVGAMAGVAAGASSAVASGAVMGKIDGKQVLTSAAIGGIGGAAAGAVVPAATSFAGSVTTNTVAQNAIVGASSGAVGGAVAAGAAGYIYDGKISAGGVAKGALYGGAFGAAGAALKPMIFGPSANAVKPSVPNGNSAANGTNGGAQKVTQDIPENYTGTYRSQAWSGLKNGLYDGAFSTMGSSGAAELGIEGGSFGDAIKASTNIENLAYGTIGGGLGGAAGALTTTALRRDIVKSADGSTLYRISPMDGKAYVIGQKQQDGTYQPVKGGPGVELDVLRAQKAQIVDNRFSLFGNPSLDKYRIIDGAYKVPDGILIQKDATTGTEKKYTLVEMKGDNANRNGSAQYLVAVDDQGILHNVGKDANGQLIATGKVSGQNVQDTGIGSWDGSVRFDGKNVVLADPNKVQLAKPDNQGNYTILSQGAVASTTGTTTVSAGAAKPVGGTLPQTEITAKIRDNDTPIIQFITNDGKQHLVYRQSDGVLYDQNTNKPVDSSVSQQFDNAMSSTDSAGRTFRNTGMFKDGKPLIEITDPGGGTSLVYIDQKGTVYKAGTGWIWDAKLEPAIAASLKDNVKGPIQFIDGSYLKGYYQTPIPGWQSSVPSVPITTGTHLVSTTPTTSSFIPSTTNLTATLNNPTPINYSYFQSGNKLIDNATGNLVFQDSTRGLSNLYGLLGRDGTKLQTVVDAKGNAVGITADGKTLASNGVNINNYKGYSVGDRLSTEVIASNPQIASQIGQPIYTVDKNQWWNPFSADYKMTDLRTGQSIAIPDKTIAGLNLQPGQTLLKDAKGQWVLGSMQMTPTPVSSSTTTPLVTSGPPSKVTGITQNPSYNLSARFDPNTNAFVPMGSPATLPPSVPVYGSTLPTQLNSLANGGVFGGVPAGPLYTAPNYQWYSQHVLQPTFATLNATRPNPFFGAGSNGMTIQDNVHTGIDDANTMVLDYEAPPMESHPYPQPYYTDNGYGYNQGYSDPYYQQQYAQQAY